MLDKLVGAAEIKDEKEKKSKYPLVRFAGQPVAGLARRAALTPTRGRGGQGEYEVLPFVTDTDKAARTTRLSSSRGRRSRREPPAAVAGRAASPRRATSARPVKGGPRTSTSRRHSATQRSSSTRPYRTQVQTTRRGDARRRRRLEAGHAHRLRVHPGTSSVRDEWPRSSASQGKVRVVTGSWRRVRRQVRRGQLGVIATHRPRRRAPVTLIAHPPGRAPVCRQPPIHPARPHRRE